jgi:4-amino-4-deoxy-L-arabinose transferase-like glycosyltransferase
VSVFVAPSRPGLLDSSNPALILAGLAFVIGTTYAWVVQPGLPYDEPSHWATVLFYADHGGMPVLGKTGVTYEAQMGPVAYIVDAIIVRAARATGASLDTTFHLVRLVGVVAFAFAVALVGAITRRLCDQSWAWVAAVAIFALNPMLLTMSSSVQNDALALALGLLALQLTLERLADRPTVASATLVGAIAGLALLTKLTAWVAVVAIAGWLVWRHRRSSLRPLLGYVGAAVAVSGWWFTRNVELYGDPTAAAGVHKSGVSFAAYHVHNASGFGHIFEEFVTYLWVPTEYVRNLISAPAVVKGALLLATLTVLVMSARRVRGWREPARWLVLCCGLLSVGSWLVTYLAYQAVAPRVAYLVLPLWVGLTALALTRVPRTVAIGVTTLLVVSLNAWTLYELSQVSAPNFIAF